MGKKRKVCRRSSFKNIEIKPGEIICTKCKGHGIIEKVEKCNKCNNGKTITPSFCEKCHGLGKLDWIQNITGVKEMPQADIEYDYYDEDIPF